MYMYILLIVTTNLTCVASPEHLTLHAYGVINGDEALLENRGPNPTDVRISYMCCCNVYV